MPQPTARICIPTTRPDSLERLYDSLARQTFKDFEVKVSTELGNLAEIRNKLAKGFKGDYLIFTDDDVRYTDTWLEGICREFERRPDVMAVTGHSVILPEFMSKRDIFSITWAKKIYDQFFCNGKQYLPGHIMPSGAFTTGASSESCSFQGEVMFTEACNMAFRNSIFVALGGFDERFVKTSEWSEPDLCFRIRRLGYKCWFSQKAKLYHEPSRSGAYKRRQDTTHRIQNFNLFRERWLKPNLKSTLYYAFFRTYMFLKGHGLV